MIKLSVVEFIIQPRVVSIDENFNVEDVKVDTVKIPAKNVEEFFSNFKTQLEAYETEINLSKENQV